MSSLGQDTSSWYVATQLHPPKVRNDIIRRPHLEEVLCHFVCELPLTLISAPAGYGKTTLLSALPSLLPDYPLAWITLEEEDNDPIRFVSLLVTALQRLHPDCGHAIWPLISGGEVSDAVLKHAAGILINDIAQYLPNHIILVLDDLHVVTQRVIYAVLDYLLDQLPKNMHVILSTRYDPPLRLTRLAVCRKMGELRRVDLSFSSYEANQLLNDTLKLNLSHDEVTALQEKTEGWPGILCLLSGPLRHIVSSENRAQLMDNMMYSELKAMDFISEEILLDLSDDVRRFVLQTSILVEMTPGICQAVTGRDDAAQMLEGLYKHNLAIASLNTDTNSEPVYRYHALFARLLKVQMEHELTREEITELHQRAALVQTTPNRAISHFISAGLWDQAAKTIAEEGTELLYKGMAETVRQWYGSLPTSIRSSQTGLQILLARCEIHRGEYAAAEMLLNQARETFVKLGDCIGEGDALTSLITICYNNNDRQSAAKYVEQALKLPLNPMGQVATRLAKAWLYMFDGNWAAVRSNVCEGLSVPYTSGDRRADLIGVTYIATPMIAVPGCMPAIEHYCDDVAKNALPDTPWSLGAQVIGVWPLLLQGRITEALNKAETAAELRQRLGGFPFIGNDLPVLLSVLYLARDDMESAGRAVKNLVRFTTSEGMNSKGIGMFYLHAAGRALALLGRYDESRIMQQRLRALDDKGPLTKYLQDHLTGLIAMLTGHDADASCALEQAAKLEINLPSAHIGGSAQLLLAQLLLNQGNPDSAFTTADPLISEWMLASTPGYAILDGQIIKPLLRMLAQRNSVGAAMMLRLFSRDLRSEDESNPAQANSQALKELLIEPLTPRECDVLKLLVVGRTNLQIGKELYISGETVKSHIAHLFRKLDVSSRAQAAIRARELGF